MWYKAITFTPTNKGKNMALSRENYVPNTTENIDKLIRKVMEVMDIDALRREVHLGLVRHYVDNDQCFVEDYYETFPEEDPGERCEKEGKVLDKVIYYHGRHSNPCVVGEVVIPEFGKDGSLRGYDIIAVTHKMECEDYGDDLSDVTKVWDAHVQVEVLGFDRYDTDYDSCIHIPLALGEHTALVNQVLKQILLNNNVEIVKVPGLANRYTLEEFVLFLEKV